MSQDNDPSPAGHGWFTTTHWSVVLAAKATESPQAQGALEQLCRTYWYRLYAYLRRRGHQSADAEDLVQGLFAKLLGQDFLKNVSPDRGRFRSFLLACLQHYLADQNVQAMCQKRGHGRPPISLDAASAEDRYLKESVQGEDPESYFEDRLVRPTTLEIQLANADGTNAKQLTKLNAASFAPAWFRDGRHVIFASNYLDPKGRNFDLFMMNDDGSGLERVTYNETFDGFPLFSRDGKKLVFASNRNNAKPGDTNIFVADWIP